MELYKNREEKEKELIKYLRKNPIATYRQIKEDTKIKVERIYPKNSMRQAYLKAGIPFSKSLRKRTRKQMFEEVIKFIKKNPTATTVNIIKELGINIPRVFGTIVNAYSAAGIKYPRYFSKIFYNKSDRMKDVIKYIKSNPLASVVEINKNLKLSTHKLFSNMNKLYEKAGIKYINGHLKRTLKKRKLIINYIKENPLATQWEINKKCNTHVQELFKGGIREAYKLARIGYPKERLIIYGAAKKNIRLSAKKFEDNIVRILKKYGRVKRSVKTKRGIADVLFHKDDKKFIIEIKNFITKPISFSEIKQLYKYMVDLNYNKGILICKNPNKKKKVYIGKNNKIFILTINEFVKNFNTGM